MTTAVIAVALVAIAAFAVAFRFSGLVRRATAANADVREVLGVMGDKAMDDDEKEVLVQRAALRMFRHFAAITVAAVLVLAAPAIVMLAADATGLATFDAVSAFLLRWDVMIGATVLLGGGYWLVARRR